MLTDIYNPGTTENYGKFHLWVVCHMYQYQTEYLNNSNNFMQVMDDSLEYGANVGWCRAVQNTKCYHSNAYYYQRYKIYNLLKAL